MKNIILKSLELVNFKGISHVQFDDLNPKENSFFGKNEAGKTTLFNAFLWLLFGKDLNNRKDYEIKPLDSNNKPTKGLNSEVHAVLLINNEEVTISRIYKEKWRTIKGSEDKTFDGHETELIFNSVPVALKEFNLKISEIVKEDVFKLITNPLAFEALKWQEKRAVLVSVVGELTDQELFDSDEEFKTLESKLSNKTLAEYDAQLKASIKKSKEEKEDTPARIDELKRSKIEEIDFELIESQISNKKELITDIDSQIENSGKSVQKVIDANTKVQQEIQALNSQKSQIEINLRAKAKQECFVDTSSIDALKTKLNNTSTMLVNSNNYLDSLKHNISTYESNIKALEADKADLVSKYTSENAKVFDAEKYSCTCPNCQTKFIYNDEPEKEFNIEKNQKLSKIIEQGNSIKAKIEEYQNLIKIPKGQIPDVQTDIEKHTSEINSLKDQIQTETNNLQSPKNEEEVYLSLINDDAQISKLNIEISTLQSKIKEVKQADVSELKQQKQALQSEIDSLNEKKASKSINDNLDKRIEELSSREKELSQVISSLEKEQFIIERFKKVKSESLENSVNKLFKTVKFKLFEEQVNGGLNPTCIALIDGVPFLAANTASQINAGLDIINTLCKANEVTAPIFIDNRESVTELIPTDSQIINLVVSPEHEVLTLIK
ncbi:AAA family ATPase [Chishuiella sp.]|uniref:AAA family ATPase n=1 Tax=Chishuiella sp. TaxID=1969467 RepID=UPI0028AB1C33|nr:AAA family ATPase [Chishuiella sp.]